MSKMAKIPVIFHWGFLLWMLVILLPSMWPEGNNSGAAIGYYYLMIMFIPIFSLIIHELGHVLAGWMYGYEIKSVHFSGFYAYCVMDVEEEKYNNYSGIVVSFAGPLANMILAGLLYLIMGYIPDNMRFFAEYGAMYNVLMVVFNLWPLPKTDGNSILWHFILRRANRINGSSEFSLIKDIDYIKTINRFESIIRCIQLISWAALSYILWFFINLVIL